MSGQEYGVHLAYVCQCKTRGVTWMFIRETLGGPFLTIRCGDDQIMLGCGEAEGWMWVSEGLLEGKCECQGECWRVNVRVSEGMLQDALEMT